MRPKTILSVENGILFLLMFILFVYFHFSILYFCLFLLLPDISMLGYLKNPVFGANLYNLGHHLAVPILLFFLYLMTQWTLLLPISLIWAAHIFMDRTLGYGVKYPDEFKHTHIQNL